MSYMTPREIVHELDKHIIGQDAAKRAVAVALRDRWRRSQVDDVLENTELDARAVAEKAMGIAADICVYTNNALTIESLRASGS